MKERQQYKSLQNKAGLYIRLSREDAGDGESSSIGTQREILTKFAADNSLIVIDEYVDDGYSGTNFDRPAFKRMIDDIEKGKINCVISKDTSRLGRNVAKTLELTDEYFPLHNVRYIAINEGYDSAARSNGIATVMPLMASINEYYARDTSAKIRSAIYSKMESGEYIASFAPYGYKKDTEHGNKNRLVIDPVTAPIVQSIFRMAAENHRPSEIAQYLNEKGIATPMEYRLKCRPYLSVDKYSLRKEWSAVGISKMLRNEVYLGKTLQGKTTKVTFKSKAVKNNSRSEWHVVEGTHEPLVSEEVFRMARNRCISRRSPPTKGFHNIFAGIAVCADCGKSMATSPSRKKGATYNLVCGGYKAHGAKECSNHAIDYDLLYQTVQKELQALLSLAPKEREMVIAALIKDAHRRRENDASLRALEQMKIELKKLESSMRKLYEDFAAGRITSAMYETIAPQYEVDMSTLKKSISMAKERIEQQPHATEMDAYHKFFALLDEVVEVKELSKSLLTRLIDRIEVRQGEYIKDEDGKKHKRQTINIYYRFIGQIG